MCLGHREHPVQALPANRSDHALADRVRLGACERRSQDLQAQGANRIIQALCEDPVAASTRRGRTPRSTNSASCRRKNRFSARTTSVERNSGTNHRMASSIRRSAIPAKVTIGSSSHIIRSCAGRSASKPDAILAEYSRLPPWRMTRGIDATIDFPGRGAALSKAAGRRPDCSPPVGRSDCGSDCVNGDSAKAEHLLAEAAAFSPVSIGGSDDR